MPSVGGRIRLLVPFEVDRYWIAEDVRCVNDPQWDDRIGYGEFFFGGELKTDFYYLADYSFLGLSPSTKTPFSYSPLWNIGTATGQVSYSFQNDTGSLVYPGTSSWSGTNEVGTMTCPKLRLPVGSEATITHTETTCTGYSMMLVLFDSPYLNDEPYWFPQQTILDVNFVQDHQRMRYNRYTPDPPSYYDEDIMQWVMPKKLNIPMLIPVFEEL